MASSPLTAERRYQLTRIRSGDYIFPSNDGKTIWRVSRYEEDASLGGDTHGTFWMSAKFNGSPEQAQRLIDRDPDDFLAWDQWTCWETFLKTRAEAIDSALKAAAAMPEP